MKTLVELKAANLPKATCESVGIEITPTDGADSAEAQTAIAKVNEYLALFVAGEGSCVKCGIQLGGFFGTFTWGLVYGEGFCAKCNYPARATHRIESVGTISGFLLQYHPDVLEEAENAAEEA